VVTGNVIDPQLRLIGANGIVGRSVVVTADGNREFQCVIGTLEEGVRPTPTPQLPFLDDQFAPGAFRAGGSGTAA
jgi:hypothetical protein